MPCGRLAFAELARLLVHMLAHTTFAEQFFVFFISDGTSFWRWNSLGSLDCFGWLRFRFCLGLAVGGAGVVDDDGGSAVQMNESTGDCATDSAIWCWRGRCWRLSAVARVPCVPLYGLHNVHDTFRFHFQVFSFDSTVTTVDWPKLPSPSSPIQRNYAL